jgi:hypothetical protein
VRFLAKSIATGTISTIVENVALSEARGNLTYGRGLGEPLILDFLARIPGITTRTVSVNLARRNLTKGQQAMLRAVAYPAPKRGTHSELTQSTGEFDKALLSRARTVPLARSRKTSSARSARQPLHWREVRAPPRNDLFDLPADAGSRGTIYR